MARRISLLFALACTHSGACAADSGPHPGGRQMSASHTSDPWCAAIDACAANYEIVVEASGNGSAPVAGIAIFLARGLPPSRALEVVLQCDGHGPVDAVVEANHPLSDRIVYASTGFGLPGGTTCELLFRSLTDPGPTECVEWFTEVDFVGRSKVEVGLEVAVEPLAPNCEESSDTGGQTGHPPPRR